jgi:hypothetical protein
MTNHVPVLLEECLALLAPQDGRAYMDCTFGGGGHTAALLDRAPGATVDALDRDPQAAERAAPLLAKYGPRLRFHAENFRDLDRVQGRFAGVLMDIGVSSHQLDEAGRGFSFRFDAPNDMRMDTRRGRPAAASRPSATSARNPAGSASSTRSSPPAAPAAWPARRPSRTSSRKPPRRPPARAARTPPPRPSKASASP